MLTIYICMEYTDIAKRKSTNPALPPDCSQAIKKNVQGEGEREYLRFARNVSFQVYL